MAFSLLGARVVLRQPIEVVRQGRACGGPRLQRHHHRAFAGEDARQIERRPRPRPGPRRRRALVSRVSKRRPSRATTLAVRRAPARGSARLSISCRRRVGQGHLHVHGLGGGLEGVEGGGGVIIVADELPHGSRAQADCVIHSMRPLVLRHSSAFMPSMIARVGVVVHQLRLALEVLKTRGRAVLAGQRVHEAVRVAVPALMPVVIGPGVADRPAIGGRDRGFESLQRGERRRADLHREALAVAGEVGLRRAGGRRGLRTTGSRCWSCRCTSACRPASAPAVPALR